MDPVSSVTRPAAPTAKIGRGHVLLVDLEERRGREERPVERFRLRAALERACLLGVERTAGRRGERDVLERERRLGIAAVDRDVRRDFEQDAGRRID